MLQGLCQTEEGSKKALSFQLIRWDRSGTERVPFPEDMIQSIVQLQNSSRHSGALTKEGYVYLWGRHTDYDPVLGLGMKSITLDTPTLLSYNSESRCYEPAAGRPTSLQISEDPITSIYLGHTTTVLLSKKGKIFFTGRLGPVMMTKLELIEELDSQHVLQVAQHGDHLLILSSVGDMSDETCLFLYSPLPDVSKQERKSLQLTEVGEFRDMNVTQISASSTHCAALKSNGEVFIWSEPGLLIPAMKKGLRGLGDLNTPGGGHSRKIESFSFENVSKIACGMDCTFVLLYEECDIKVRSRENQILSLSEAIDAGDSTPRRRPTLMSFAEESVRRTESRVFVWGRPKSFDVNTMGIPSQRAALSRVSDFSLSEDKRDTYLIGLNSNGKIFLNGSNMFLRLPGIPSKSLSPQILPFPNENRIAGLENMVSVFSPGQKSILGLVHWDCVMVYLDDKSYCFSANLHKTIGDIVKVLSQFPKPPLSTAESKEEINSELLSDIHVFDAFGGSLSADQLTTEIIIAMKQCLDAPLLFAVRTTRIMERECSPDLLFDYQKGLVTWATPTKLVELLFSHASGNLCQPLGNPQLKATASPVRKYDFMRVFLLSFNIKPISLDPKELLLILMDHFQQPDKGFSFFLISFF